MTKNSIIIFFSCRSNDTSTNRKTGQYSADIHPDFDTSVMSMEATPKIKECVSETSNDLLISKPSDKNDFEEFSSKEIKSDQTSGIIDSENSGQTTGMIGSDSTLQVRGFCEKLSLGKTPTASFVNVLVNFVAKKSAGVSNFVSNVLYPCFGILYLFSILTSDVMEDKVFSICIYCPLGMSRQN
jgi:hypothetical protein